MQQTTNRNGRGLAVSGLKWLGLAIFGLLTLPLTLAGWLFRSARFALAMVLLWAMIAVGWFFLMSALAWYSDGFRDALLDFGLWTGMDFERGFDGWSVAGVLSGLTIVALFVSGVLAGLARESEGDTHGTAAFAGRDDMSRAGLLSGVGLLLGKQVFKEPILSLYKPEIKRLRYPGPAHLLTIAPTRAGKGVGAIIPNLLTYGGSVLCIDPKGENARITAAVRRDELGQAVFVLDPYGVSGCAGSVGLAAFDPLAAIDPFGPDAVDDARLVADTLVSDPPDQRGEAHWNEEAKALIAGIVLHLLTVGRAGERDLSALRAALTGSPEDFRRLLTTMAANPACDGVIARSAHRMMGKSEREFAGVVSSAQRHTHFLDGPRMRAVTGRSDFSLADLKTGSSSPKGGSRPGRPITVYLVLPPERLATHGRWLRLMVAQALQTLARTPGRGGPSVLFLLDEFAALGRLEAVETAFGLMAGYGVQIWPFLQDLSQLRALYGEKAGTFLANAGVLQAFGVNDHATARLLSDMLGQSTVLQVTQSQGQSVTYGSLFSGVETTWSENSGTSTGPTGRPLLMPDEIRRMGADEQLLFVQGQPPIRTGKIRWFDEPDMAALVADYPTEKHS
ncbi:MAG: type IV secretory system conjugative DNA transfer family protein [Geminicoccaceae bacterium]